MRNLLLSVLVFLTFLFCLTMFFVSGGNASWLADE
jgi:hypothetical protein